MSTEAATHPLFHGILDHDSGPIAGILDATETCLSRSGYGGMSMRDIAKEAGVSKSLLHYHFQSKEHLFLEMQIRVYNRLAILVAEAVAPIESGKQRTRLALGALFDVLRTRGELPVHAEILARSLSNDKLRVRALAVSDHLRQVIIRTLTQILGADRDWLPFPVEVAADLLLGALTGLGLQAGVEGRPERADKALAALLRLVDLAIDATGAEPSED
jgi:AcrR family transcriptional regulator